MKNTNLFFALCMFFSAALFSCSKKTNTVSTPKIDTTVVVKGPTYSSMDTIFGMLAIQPKTLTVDAATGGSFYGSSGTRYIFLGNSFQNSAGAFITGPIQIQVSEYLQKGDMLFSKMLPISNNEPLLSGGEINVIATQNGQPVYLRPHTSFQANLPQPGTPPAGMLYFTGQPTLDTTQFKTNWIQPIKDSSRYNINAIVTNTIGDTLSIVSDSLRLCNADAFMTLPDYQTFTVTITTTGAALTSSIRPFGYTLYDTYKGVWPLGYIGGYSNGVFTEKHVPNIPVHFVVFTLIGGKFYAGTLGSVTPATGMNYTINLSETDPVAFKTLVNGL